MFAVALPSSELNVSENSRAFDFQCLWTQVLKCLPEITWGERRAKALAHALNRSPPQSPTFEEADIKDLEEREALAELNAVEAAAASSDGETEHCAERVSSAL